MNAGVEYADVVITPRRIKKVYFFKESLEFLLWKAEDLPTRNVLLCVCYGVTSIVYFS